MEKNIKAKNYGFDFKGVKTLVNRNKFHQKIFTSWKLIGNIKRLSATKPTLLQ